MDDYPARLPLVPEGVRSELQERIIEELTEGVRAQRSARRRIDADGRLSGPFQAMLVAPEVGYPLQALGSAIRYRSSIPDRLRELAILFIAGRLDSEYEWAAHVGLGRNLGLNEEQLESLRGGETPTGISLEERVALTVVEVCLADGRLGPGSYASLLETLGVVQLVELSTLVGYYRLLAIQLELFDVH